MLAFDSEKCNAYVDFVLDERKWGKFQVLISF